MTKLRKILVYVNLAKEGLDAVERAVKLAKASKAVLKLVDVVSTPALAYGPLPFPPFDLSEAVTSYKRQRLEEIAKGPRADGVTVLTDVLHGSPGTELIREVIRHHFDLVMKTAEGGVLNRLFGTTGMQLLRRCPCAVELVKPSLAVARERVLVALDPAPDDPERDAVNAQLLAIAAEATKLEGTELHVVHVWHPFAEEVLLGRAGVSPEELEGYYDAERAKAQEALETTISRHAPGLPSSRVHLVRGRPDDAIERLARDEHVDLVVLGVKARRGVAQVLIGSTAERIVGTLDCSLLAVKPEGFVSPIKVEDDVPESAGLEPAADAMSH